MDAAVGVSVGAWSRKPESPDGGAEADRSVDGPSAVKPAVEAPSAGDAGRPEGVDSAERAVEALAAEEVRTSWAAGVAGQEGAEGRLSTELSAGAPAG